MSESITRPRVDLVSDTATRPSSPMLAAMMNAETGDEQRREDPTVERLCGMVAGMLEKDDALFLPSGTMCNLIATLVHCHRGDEILVGHGDHICNLENAGAPAVAGVSFRMMENRNGIVDPEAVEKHIRPPGSKHPRSRMLIVEQTSNTGGGTVTPISVLSRLRCIADAYGLVIHMDGARLLNAAVAAGSEAGAFASWVDTVWVDLSKGLGCPVGAVLAGSNEFIESAWIWKHRLGGGMRQAGILAAAGIYALEHNVSRLAVDHANASTFAAMLECVPGVRFRNERIETNIVYVDVSSTGMSAGEIKRGLLQRGIRIGAEDDIWMRAVTHLGVSENDIKEAAGAFVDVINRR